MPQDSVAGASQEKFSQPRMTVGAHHQKIDLVGLDESFKDLTDRTSVELQHVKARFDVMLRKVLYQILAGL